MVLVYTHAITPRLRFVFKHIFTRILQVEVDFTTKIEDFISYNGVKMSYTTKSLGDEFFIKSHPLLFEQGLRDVDINVLQWEDVPCFFLMGKKSAIPFDVFASSFYLISRYEEYLPQIKDKHQRFRATESIAYKYNFLEKPIVDIWAFKLAKSLKLFFPKFEIRHREFNFISTININQPYIYKHRNILRTLVELIYNLIDFNLVDLLNRFLVLFNLKKDPYNTFSEILRLQKEYNVKTIFFFLIGDLTTKDANVSVTNKYFRLLIKDMVDYATVGLQASYNTSSDLELLKKEKEKLEKVTNIPTARSRQHFFRVQLPQTYHNLISLDVKEDYSMCYADYVGFRASTCTPFYFYDLDFEIQTPLKVFPVAFVDLTLRKNLILTPKQSIGKIRDLKNEVKKVNGTFVTVFHNSALSNYRKWKGWSKLYRYMFRVVLK